jgi:hypothetical protein
MKNPKIAAVSILAMLVLGCNGDFKETDTTIISDTIIENGHTYKIDEIEGYMIKEHLFLLCPDNHIENANWNDSL